jgi:hypothetical protein
MNFVTLKVYLTDLISSVSLRTINNYTSKYTKLAGFKTSVVVS